MIPKLTWTMTLILLVALAGCGGAPTPEQLADRSLDVVRKQADELSVQELQQQASLHRDAARDLDRKIDELRQQRRSLSFDELTGEKAAQIDQSMKDLGELTRRLRDRHGVFVDKLRQKGVSTEEYKI